MIDSFATKVLEIIKTGIVEGGYEIDLYELADIAVAEGLISYVHYDPAIHENVDSSIEPGEYIYYWGKS